jgi:hypothetical protein
MRGNSSISGDQLGESHRGAGDLDLAGRSRLWKARLFCDHLVQRAAPMVGMGVGEDDCDHRPRANGSVLSAASCCAMTRAEAGFGGHFLTLPASILIEGSSILVVKAVCTSNGFSMPR